MAFILFRLKRLRGGGGDRESLGEASPSAGRPALQSAQPAKNATLWLSEYRAT
jgi:hypothetical protein